MKFTRDICRLLGLGGDGAGEEEMEVQDDLTDRRKEQGSSQATLNGEDDDDNDERTRRRAEKRRAKRKRQKERKKLEREERTEEQEEEAAGAASESDSEDELKEEDEEWTAVRPRNKCNPEPVPVLATGQKSNNQQLPHRTSEEEPEWDVSSAFVAKVASHIKIKTSKSRTSQICRENKENDTRSSQQVERTDEMRRRGETFTVQGIQMFGKGEYSRAVDMFTEAIHCDPDDHRFYGNRSYCYWCLEQFYSALSDAQRSIQLAPDWPKGYFRKGCALMGLKRYSEAEKAMEQVLKLDHDCNEASSKLRSCRLLQLVELGFDEEQSKMLLEKFSSVQAVVASPEARVMKHTPLQDQSRSCRSLWVGNITLEVTDKDLRDLFKIFGEIESIRVLHERFCAFVNFKNANTAARALEKLQGVELGSSKLVMRYPDRWIQRTNGSLGPGATAGSRRCVPIDGDKCFYWQTTGCFYGDKCRFKHIPQQQGRDVKQ